MKERINRLSGMHCTILVLLAIPLSPLSIIFKAEISPKSYYWLHAVLVILYIVVVAMFLGSHTSLEGEFDFDLVPGMLRSYNHAKHVGRTHE